MKGKHWIKVFMFCLKMYTDWRIEIGINPQGQFQLLSGLMGRLKLCIVEQFPCIPDLGWEGFLAFVMPEINIHIVYA